MKSQPSKKSTEAKLPSPPGYKMGRVLGQGGMGVVYLGKQISLNRKVAIKVLHPQFTQMVHVKRLLREGRALATLRHNNILSVIDFIQSEGRIYLIMEYIEGVTLSKVITKLKTAKRPTAGLFKKCCKGGDDWTYPDHHYFDLIRKVFVDLAKGMQHAHEHKILHRDIKPSNIMITASGNPFLLDFGLSTVASEVTLTNPQEILGTPLYMAPEQIEGATLTPTTDIYSLGATLYQTLGLKTAHTATSQIALLHSVVNKEPKPISQINPHLPRAFEKIVSKSMNKNPDMRYPSMQDMIDDLESLKFSDGPQDLGPQYHAPPSQGFMPWIYLMVGLLLMGLGIWWFLNRPTSEVEKNIVEAEQTVTPEEIGNDISIKKAFSGKVLNFVNNSVFNVKHPVHGPVKIKLAYLLVNDEAKPYIRDFLATVLKDKEVLVNPVQIAENGVTPAEIICNGAMVNAAVLSTGLVRLAEFPPPPRKYLNIEHSSKSMKRGGWNPKELNEDTVRRLTQQFKQKFQ